LLLGSAEVGASPADVFGFGARNQALGATGATGRGYEASYGNPAQLSDRPERRLTLGYAFARFNPEARNATGKLPIRRDAFSAFVLGLTAPVPLHENLRDRLVLGLGATLPSNVIARVRLLQPGTPQFPLLTDRVQSLSFNLGLGANLGYGVRIGVGAMVLAELLGEVTVDSDAQGTLATRVDDELLLVAAPVLGVSAELSSQLKAALSYRGELQSDFDLVVNLGELGSITLPPLHVAGVGQYDPAQLQAELSYQFGDTQLIGGAVYRFTSGFPGYLRPTVQCPSGQSCQALPAPPLELVDTLSPRLAVAQHVSLAAKVSGELRVGYFFEPSPLPDDLVGSQVFDNTRHVLTLGYGIDADLARIPLRLDWTFQHHFLVSRSFPDTTGSGQVETGGGADLFAVTCGGAF
jgi:long-chain fatty acid transport protein